jgi:dolichyl-phosphate-mannose--protein O-mannosyl transferase
MLFVQSRIGMNDAYVGVFIVAAYTLFAAIWTGSWRWRGAFWVAMPVIGLLLGLALASKWVGLYAIGGIGLLIIVRSASAGCWRSLGSWRSRACWATSRWSCRRAAGWATSRSS